MISSENIFVAFALGAVVLGTYVALPKPDLQQWAVSVPTEAGINQAIPSDSDEKSFRLISSSPARSVRSSWQWRERVRAVVQQTAATRDYRLYKALYDKPDYPDPDARTIFFFKSSKSTNPAPHGLLVLTPEDYVALAVLDETVFEAEIDQRLFGHWATDHGQEAEALAAFSQHVLDLVSILYAQPKIDQKCRIAMVPPHSEAPLAVECGEFRLSLDRSLMEHLFQQPAMDRDRHIAEMVGKGDPKIMPYLRGSDLAE
jgi:hypothetical protein